MVGFSEPGIRPGEGGYQFAADDQRRIVILADTGLPISLRGRGRLRGRGGTARSGTARRRHRLHPGRAGWSAARIGGIENQQQASSDDACGQKYQARR